MNIYIVEKSSGKNPLSLGNSSDASQDEMTVKEIISVYSIFEYFCIFLYFYNHPSILALCVADITFDLPYTITSDSYKIIKSLNIKKAKGPGGISEKFVKMSANVIDCHLANIINNDISSRKYSRHAKTATVSFFSKKMIEQI